MIVFKRMALSIILTLILLFIGLFCYNFWWWHQPLQSHRSEFRVYQGDNQRRVLQSLAQRGMIRHPGYIRWSHRWPGHHYRMHYGEYTVSKGETLWDLLQSIDQQKNRVKHWVTFKEGITFSGVLSVLAGNPNLRHTLKGLSHEQVLTALNVSYASGEGLFFPDTYQFYWGNTDQAILLSAYQAMQHRLDLLWVKRQKGLAYKTPYEALIVASLIESETPVDKEKPLISGVIAKRLAQGMRLQLDPTVVYGLGLSSGAQLKKSQLKKESAYNTYLIKGLPPTPIGLPGQASLDAAMNPLNRGYLYYVSTGHGGHTFSRDYAQHVVAVKRYRTVTQQRSERQQVNRDHWLQSWPSFAYYVALPVVYSMYFQS